MKIQLKEVITPNTEIGADKGFQAQLYIRGRYVGEARNTGNNAPSTYRANSFVSEHLIQSAEEYFQSLPGKIMTLSFAIDQEFLRHEVVAGIKKYKEYQPGWEKDSFVILDGQKHTYHCVHLKLDLAELRILSQGEKTILRLLYAFVLPNMKMGDKLLTGGLPGWQLEKIQGFLRVNALFDPKAIKKEYGHKNGRRRKK